MRGGKREGAGRHPRFGRYRETTTMRVPAPLKQEIIAFIERLCADTAPGHPHFETKSKLVGRQGMAEKAAISRAKITQLSNVLEGSLKLRSNAGGAIKKEIRKALKILQS